MKETTNKPPHIEVVRTRIHPMVWMLFFIIVIAVACTNSGCDGDNVSVQGKVLGKRQDVKAEYLDNQINESVIYLLWIKGYGNIRVSKSTWDKAVLGQEIKLP